MFLQKSVPKGRVGIPDWVTTLALDLFPDILCQERERKEAGTQRSFIDYQHEFELEWEVMESFWVFTKVIRNKRDRDKKFIGPTILCRSASPEIQESNSRKRDPP